MRRIRINAARPYEYLIGSGLLDRTGELVRPLTRARRAAIVCGDAVATLYAGRVEKSLSEHGFSVYTHVVPRGEASKDLVHYGELLSFLARSGITRDDVIVAVGGGVTGDLAGFAAATYRRGVGFVHIATTLLAAVDASVGGKSAIDLPEGKNLAGCFRSPLAVICDTDCFKTLPERELRCGCAEIVKYGALFDAELLRSLSRETLAKDVEGLVSRCVELKAAVVEADEFDSGERMLLNLGHSFGHAIESRSGYETSHGEAVAAGMAMIARAAAKRGFCSSECCREIEAKLTELGLPVGTTLPADELIAALAGDKKLGSAGMRLIVPEEPGRCRILELSFDEAAEWLRDGMRIWT